MGKDLLHRDLLLSLTVSIMQSISNVCVIPQVNEMIYENPWKLVAYRYVSHDWQWGPLALGAFIRAASCMSSLWSHPKSSCCKPWGRRLPGQDLFTWQPVSLKLPGTLSLHICKIWLKQAETMTSCWVRAGGAEMIVQTYTNTLPSIHARTGLHKAMLQGIQAQCTVMNQILLDLAQNKWFCCWSAVCISAFCV